MSNHNASRFKVFDLLEEKVGFVDASGSLSLKA